MSTNSDQCGFSGNPDFYGLGIRLGVYLQWTTAVLALYLHTEAVSENLDTNAIFVFALFVALLSATVRGQVRAAEVVVLLQLCWGFLLGVLTIWGHRLREDYGKSKREPIRYPLMGSLFRLSLTVAVCAYSVWFWFSGAQDLATSTCPAFIFIFAKANIRGGIRIFFQLQFALIMIPVGVLYFWEVMLIAWFYITTGGITILLVLGFSVYESRRGTWWSFRDGMGFLIKKGPRLALALSWARANGKRSTGPQRPDLAPWLLWFLKGLKEAAFLAVGRILSRWAGREIEVRSFPTYLRSLHTAALKLERSDKFRLAVRLANITYLFWSVLSIELTLIWNQIDGVYDVRSTGQLIPFVIGLFGLLKFFHVMSVQNSDVQANDAIMELFDHDMERKVHLEDDVEAYPLNESSVAYFRKYEIFHRHSFEEYNRHNIPYQGDFGKGRHSVDCMRSLRIDKDDEGPSVYERNGVEIQILRGDSKTIVQKDFRKKLRPVRIQTDDMDLEGLNDDEGQPITTDVFLKEIAAQIRSFLFFAPFGRITPSFITHRRKKRRHIYGSQLPPPLTKTDITHKRAQNEIQRSIYSFCNRRPVYILGSTAADALAKILDDLHLSNSAQTTSVISEFIDKAKTIRKERRDNHITRREQLEKFRSLRVDLAIRFDRNNVRDGEVVLRKVIDLVMAARKERRRSSTMKKD